MKVLLAISLLFLLLYQMASHLLIFKIQQYQIRKEIKQQIKIGVPDDALVLLKIPLSIELSSNRSFRWYEEGEFRFQGEMYDVVRQESHGDTTWYYCLWDEEESDIFAQLDEQVAQHMRQNREQKKQHELLDRLLEALYLSENQCYLSIPCIKYDADGGYYAFSLKNWSKSPPTPPPIIVI